MFVGGGGGGALLTVVDGCEDADVDTGDDMVGAQGDSSLIALFIS